MSSWHSYSSIYNLGHRAVAELLKVPVNLEEKVDGSQFSFGVFAGTVRVRSKGQELVVDAPEKMFKPAVASVLERKDLLHDGWTYRGEFLGKPKHNALTYGRVPVGNIIIFDIATDEEAYLGYREKAAEAQRIGLECVPLLFAGEVKSAEEIRALLEAESILGGTKIEGVVIKPSGYGLFGPDKKALMGKFVSEAFKEVHTKEWKDANPTGKDILRLLGAALNTEARWQKAIQHLKEAGTLIGDPRDIGPLIKEVQADVEKECVEHIKDQLFAWAWPHVKRLSTAGLPEWYKQKALEAQFT